VTSKKASAKVDAFLLPQSQSPKILIFLAFTPKDMLRLNHLKKFFHLPFEKKMPTSQPAFFNVGKNHRFY
jgi:hypothetical protein